MTTSVGLKRADLDRAFVLVEELDAEFARIVGRAAVGTPARRAAVKLHCEVADLHAHLCTFRVANVEGDPEPEAPRGARAVR